MISIRVAIVTMIFLMRLHEIKTLHHGVQDLIPHGVRNHGVRAQTLWLLTNSNPVSQTLWLLTNSNPVFSPVMG